MMSLRDACQLGCLLHKLRHRLFGRGDASACAPNLNSDTAWKAALCQFKQVVTTTSGANWFGDGQGDWKLLEPNGVELETAVRELLEYFRIPIRTTIGHVVEDGVDPARLAAFYKMGLLLDVKGLKKANSSQGKARCAHCGRRIQKHFYEAEGCHGGQYRQGPDLVQSTGQHLMNGLQEGVH